jgi:hypothetical protein
MLTELTVAPPVELVRQGCGPGWHRARWRDRALPTGNHYREMAGRIREVAQRAHFAGAGGELLRLADNYQRRADHFDRSEPATNL